MARKSNSFRGNTPRKKRCDLGAKEVSRYAEGWILDAEVRRLSPKTITARKWVVGKLQWFLDENKCERCGTEELRQFFAYATRPNEEGRWGGVGKTTKATSSTARTHHAYLGSLFTWLVTEGLLDTSPMATLKAPVVRTDQIQPFSESQVRSLLAAARNSQAPQRNEAIVALLLDTGLRAAELCGLRMRDIDTNSRKVVVRGKGDKVRCVYYGHRAARALWAYLRSADREPSDFLFLHCRGRDEKAGLKTGGLAQLIGHLGEAAKLKGVRCSPHTFRHTFAVGFLRNGGNTFSLQQLLGHTDSKMTARYCNLAQSDIQKQHNQFGPLDGMK